MGKSLIITDLEGSDLKTYGKENHEDPSIYEIIEFRPKNDVQNKRLQWTLCIKISYDCMSKRKREVHRHIVYITLFLRNVDVKSIDNVLTT